MRLPLAGVLLFVLACQYKADSRLPTAHEIPINDIKPGQIVHDTLSKEQLGKIKRIHNAFSEVMKSSLAETIDNFKRDQHPDREIAIWLMMATAYEQFAVNKHIEEYDKKLEAFELLLMRSMATESEVLEKYQCEYLSKDEVKEIFSYYTESPRPLIFERQ
ncbi:MAG: hypothetical protein QM762_11430 [Chryseolinea sp.]